jgi:hypothetical protein
MLHCGKALNDNEKQLTWLLDPADDQPPIGGDVEIHS